MATPVTIKKIEEKKQNAQKRRDQQTHEGQLLPLSNMADSPSAHLLIRDQTDGNRPPRHIDLQPLGISGRRSRAKLNESYYQSDHPPNGKGYTNFGENHETKSEADETIAITNDLQQLKQPYRQKPKQFVQFNISARLSVPRYPYQQQHHHRGPPKPAKLKQQTVVNMPENMTTFEVTVRPSNIVCFYGKSHFLSSLYAFPLEIQGNEYQSVEHYYQACKLYRLGGPQLAQELRSIKDPLKAKMRAKEILHSIRTDNEKLQIESWKNTEGVTVLNCALYNKFNAPSLREKLLATGEALLVQSYDRDTYYAAGLTEERFREWARENDGTVLKFPTEINYEKVKYFPLTGNGKNVLGVLTMRIRSKLMESNKSDGKAVTTAQTGGVPSSSAGAADSSPECKPVNDGGGDVEHNANTLFIQMQCLKMTECDDDVAESSSVDGDGGKENEGVKK